MSKNSCRICGGEVENWKGKTAQEPEHARESLCLASAMLRISALKDLLKQSRLFIPHCQLNIDIIEEIKDALRD